MQLSLTVPVVIAMLVSLQEAGLDIPDAIRHQFGEMFEIVAALKENNLGPALQ